ncbi:cystathionine gamma-synthase [Aspergillus clavatus NRRL 1]|uniref:cystathionine gamma-synthase n=1 Tax=Aspergillus clavatus (strain ATCC 1007 / CBS 513.65 / DSM 816 / NCTC 3887 / NRRL 1 / QM 1276 / 107) TaxID=344612 RepID=A1CJ22_ASPCL|nr:cystathionine gamma-synthase [Aspergillus clavatus NRRL 1]EAW09146.1 cystathionine gamma-synthase [Aspergillus clavatus NRRL 1]
MLQEVGGPVPPNTDHAVSVSLPTWTANVAYEEGEPWIVKKMQCGYPRFFTHPIIQELAREVVDLHGNPEAEAATLFPTPKTANVCHSFMISRIPSQESDKVRVVNFVPAHHTDSQSPTIMSLLSCVIYPKQYAPIAKQVWQHSGNGISSRRGEFCLSALRDGFLIEDKKSVKVDQSSQQYFKGPRRYQGRGSGNGVGRGGAQHNATPSSVTKSNAIQDGQEYGQFIEERFGRNLSVSLADQAKLAVRRRIAGVLTADVELADALEEISGEARVAGLTESDVFLFPTGMSSIFNTHQMLLVAKGPMKSICFGFPYIDTLKTLEKWGPGCLFYGHGSSEDLDDLESRLKNGERFLALFTEFPGNPLLKSPDLRRIHALAQEYDFAVVVDETVGNFLNINVLPYADIVVSSLTKVFSGDSNVMGGSSVLNPHGRYYQSLRDTFSREYEDNLWAEDAVFLERNSRDFVSRIEKINKTTEDVTALLKNSPLVKNVYYPKYNPSRSFYEACRNPCGGYGGLFSVTFRCTAEAIAFFDHLDVLKGPSLGTNFTLSSPYTLLAHYNELEWAGSFGVESDLVRISVGLEDASVLCDQVQRALGAVSQIRA